eukprot:GILI01002414.1.p1 GENE.GILI01002414.1~~GILI01002414.1.p1  ORF type:complete len:176 (+),score=37.45 GILI01002414.1:26-553(+)
MRSNSSPDSQSLVTPAIDVKKHRYPFSVVWTPLPLITALLPFIGHTGICTSEGIIHDFAGPYYVSENDFAFGDPTKYWQLQWSMEQRQEWDKAVTEADTKFRTMNHNLCFNNCHSHVACALNRMRYKGRTDWNMVTVWLHLTLHSKYVSVGSFIQTYFWTFLIILGIAIWRIVVA